MQCDCLLLQTATITPATNANVERRDPVERRADYFRAFTYWLTHPDQRLGRILFCENSGADLTEFRQAAERSGKQVEILSIQPQELPNSNYGYSEFALIDEALYRSRLREETTHLIKTTGRLTFPDLPRLLDRLPLNIQIAVDARGKMPGRSHEKGHISIQLFIARHGFYDSLLRECYRDLAPPHQYPEFMEHMFWERLLPYKGDKDVLLRFPVNCDPEGIAAHNNRPYARPRRRMMSGLRAVSRVVAPGVWL